MTRIIVFLLLLLTSFAQNGYKLIVVISVDQMRGDYYFREKKFLNNGLKYLYDNGIVFTNCYYKHANTSTGPGHATLLTGKYPYKTGIVANNFYDYSLQKFYYCVEDLENPKERNPKLLAETTVADAYYHQNTKSKIVSISLKDRAAILMNGKNKNSLVIWYDALKKSFTTSDYYNTKPLADSLITQFNKTNPINKYSFATWNAEISDTLIEDNVIYEGTFPTGNRFFPHRLPLTSSSKFSKAFLTSPFSTEYLLELGKFIITEQELGKDKNPDLLFISISSTDYVGHRFGPDSREIWEMYYQLDKQLGDFIAFLEKKLGKNFLIILTADHGVSPIPEKVNAGRFIPSKVKKQINEFINADAVNYIAGNMIYLKPEYNTSEIKSRIKDYLLSINGIKAVYTKQEIENCKGVPQDICSLIRKDLYKTRFGDLYVLLEKNYIWGKYPASHGTLYKQDRFVPLVFFGKKLKHKQIDAPVEPTYIAPTIAEILKIDFFNSDGQSLLNYFHSP